MSSQPSSGRRRRRDPFRALAISGIVLGMLIVIGAAVLWYLTGRQSAELIGAGVTLSVGGGLRQLAAMWMEQLPEYETPPPGPPARKRSRQRDREGR